MADGVMAFFVENTLQGNVVGGYAWFLVGVAGRYTESVAD